MKVLLSDTPLAVILLMLLGGVDSVDGKDDKEEKTREVIDIEMYNFSWNFLQLGFNMLGLFWLI